MFVTMTNPTDSNIQVHKAGHGVLIEAGKSGSVRKDMVPECMAKGLVPADGGEDFSAPPELSPADRISSIMSAITQLIAANKKEDFTVHNKPRVPSVVAITGFDVTASEIADVLNMLNDTGE